MYPAMYITARNKDKKLFGHFLRWDIYFILSYYSAAPLKMYGNLADQSKFWSPNVEIGQKWPIADCYF